MKEKIVVIKKAHTWNTMAWKFIEIVKVNLTTCLLKIQRNLFLFKIQINKEEKNAII